MISRFARCFLVRGSALLLTLAAVVTPSRAPGQCLGDFDGNAEVSVSELLTAVNSALNGCATTGNRFIDNGDGTVTDTATGLMWEQKVAGADCLHCVERRMDWVTAMSSWLSEVNGFIPDGSQPESQVGLGGHEDWRVPNLVELRSLLNCQPCFSDVLGPDEYCLYLTSTTLGQSPTGVSAVESAYGTTVGVGKDTPYCVRAVRGLKQG